MFLKTLSESEPYTHITINTLFFLHKLFRKPYILTFSVTVSTMCMGTFNLRLIRDLLSPAFTQLMIPLYSRAVIIKGIFKVILFSFKSFVFGCLVWNGIYNADRKKTNDRIINATLIDTEYRLKTFIQN